MSRVLRCSGYELIKSDIVRGDGCYLYDSHGTRFIDFEAGVWCTALGHNHPRVNEAITSRLERIAHIAYRYTCDLVEEASATVLDTPGLPDGKCVFLSSGSEAVEFAVRIARRHSGRPLLLTLSDSYLSAYGSAGEKHPGQWHSFDWSECASCDHAKDCDRHCEHIEKIPIERIGGFVFEPGNAGGTVRLPPKQLIRTLAKMVTERDGLIVIDEVTTGLGRTGRWYGFQHYALEPDIVALGKGLGNGYPVSAVAIRGDIAEILERSDFHYAQSHQNDPLGAAVAKEVVSVLDDEGLIERSERLGGPFLDGLVKIGGRHELVTDVRGRGLMTAIELVSGDRVTSVHRTLLERGFIVGCKPEARILRFYPPLIIPEGDMTHLLEDLDDILGGA